MNETDPHAAPEQRLRLDGDDYGPTDQGTALTVLRAAYPASKPARAEAVAFAASIHPAWSVSRPVAVERVVSRVAHRIDSGDGPGVLRLLASLRRLVPAKPDTHRPAASRQPGALDTHDHGAAFARRTYRLETTRA